MKIEYIDIDELKPFEKNPKAHPEEQIKRIVRSIREFGFTNPILALKENNMVVAGHARLKAARQMNLSQVPVIFLDMPYEKAIAYVVADNRLAELAEWDNTMLLPLLDDIKLSGIDVELTGFTAQDISLMSKKEVQEDDFDAEKAVEAIKEPVTKLGDVWILGKHRLCCGDSTKREDVEKLMDGKKADMVFTDPPYGFGKKIMNDDKTEVELKAWNKLWLPNTLLYTQDNAHFICFHSPRLFPTVLMPAVESWRFKRYMTLYKPNDETFPWQGWILKSESILFFTKGKPKYIKVDPYLHDTMIHNHGKELKENIGGHPASKPLPFISELLRRFDVDIILDLFGGSGSTMIAGEQLNHTVYTVELDPRYCDVICQRFEKFTGIKPVKEDHGQT